MGDHNYGGGRLTREALVLRWLGAFPGFGIVVDYYKMGTACLGRWSTLNLAWMDRFTASHSYP